MLANSHPVLQALLGTLFTWSLPHIHTLLHSRPPVSCGESSISSTVCVARLGLLSVPDRRCCLRLRPVRFVTAVGASLVFFVPSNLSLRHHRLLLDSSLGFAAGVMLAASYFSLLAPAIEFAQDSGQYGENGSWSFVPASIGVLLGGLFVHLSDRLLPHSETDTVTLLAAQHRDAGKRRAPPTAGTSDGSGTSTGAETDSVEPSSPRLPRQQLMRRTRSTTAAAAAAASSGPAKVGKKKAAAMRRMDSVQLLDNMESQAADEQYSNGDGKQLTSKSAASATSTSSPASSASWRRLMLMIIAIVIHNFPEGMAVGVAFGATAADQPTATALPAATASFQSAVSLTIGIALQNFPEGLAVSLPLLRLGYSPLRSFFYGQLSGLVEPFGGVLGAAVVGWVQPVLPYALAFAAGAMIYVVMDDLAVEIKSGGDEETAESDGGSGSRGHEKAGSGSVGMAGVMVGFVVMMALDVALG